MAEELHNGDRVKFNSFSMGIPVKISRFMGPRVSVSSFSGKFLAIL